jgi:hypothetical protein
LEIYQNNNFFISAYQNDLKTLKNIKLKKIIFFKNIFEIQKTNRL